jgi:hypothetical protein
MYESQYKKVFQSPRKIDILVINLVWKNVYYNNNYKKWNMIELFSEVYAMEEIHN